MQGMQGIPVVTLWTIAAVAWLCATIACLVAGAFVLAVIGLALAGLCGFLAQQAANRRRPTSPPPQ
jgi:hypothetical protein